MTDPKVVRYIAVVVLYLAAAVVFVEGLGSEKQFLKATSWIPGAIMIALTLYERWLWKFGPWGLPILSGTWRVTLNSNWRDPAAPDTPVIRTGYFVFRQTATLFSVTLYTNESGSLTLASQLQKQNDGQYSLSWVYENVSQLDPKVSPMHFGSVVAQQVSGRKVREIRGVYFTNRKSDGSFCTSGKRNRKRASSFASAEELLKG
jgi:hypothetical protein